MNATFESHVAVARKSSKGEIGNLARRNGKDKKHGRSVLIVCRMISQKPYTASRYAVGVHYCKDTRYADSRREAKSHQQ